MEFTLLNIFSTIVIFQLLLLAAFLFTIRTGNRSANRILGLFFLLLAINLSDGLLTFYGFYQKFPALAHLEDGMVFLFGPLLYFYTLAVVRQGSGSPARYVWHFVPFLLFTIVFQLTYQLQGDDFQLMVQESIKKQTLPTAFYVTILLVYMHVFTYVGFSLRSINGFREKLKQQFSDLRKLNLDWLVFMLLSFSGVLILSLVNSLLPLTGTNSIFNFGILVVIFVLCIFINMVVWKALHYPEIFLSDEPDQKAKYGGVVLPETEKLKIQDALNRISVEKFFLDPGLRLDDLAAKIQVPSKRLSQFINENYGQNFFDYINTRRIEYARQIMETDPDPKLTVLEIMYQSGFNSKSSFNTLFRMKTGKTPSEYRKLSRSTLAEKRSTS